MSTQIPEKMLAAQVTEFKKPYTVHEVATPGKNLEKYDMLVKIAVGSLCHTDGMVSEGDFGTALPCTASHEGSGTVVKVGSSISEFKVGDRVLCNISYHRCGTCADCKGAEEGTQYCRNAQYLGVTRDGSFAEYEVVDGRECCMLPENLTFESAAPLACAGTTVWGGIVKAGLKAGSTLAIVGAGGGLGHLGVQFAKALGLKVIAIDARDEGLALAKQCGADTVIDARSGKEKVIKQVEKVTNGQRADATLNVSDHETAAATSVAVTKMHGIMIQIAQPPNVSVPFAEFIFRDVRIHGSLTSSRGECQKMLKLVAENNIKVKTNPFTGLHELPKAVELAHSGKMQGKPVVLIDLEAIKKEKASGMKMV